MLTSLLRRTTLCTVALCVLSGACAGSRRNASGPGGRSPASCTGEIQLQVSNATERDLEVVKSLGTTQAVVGTVSPMGQTTLTVELGAMYFVQDRSTGIVVAWEGTTRSSRIVRFRRSCAD